MIIKRSISRSSQFTDKSTYFETKYTYATCVPDKKTHFNKLKKNLLTQEYYTNLNKYLADLST